MALAAVPSSLLIGTTAHLTTDVASVPLLWVVPLVLYLLTFMLAFARRDWIPRWLPERMLPVTVLAWAFAMLVGATDPTTGQAIVGYVILRGTAEATDELREQIRQHVATKLGAIARPRAVIVVPDLPKTRSGKIMRRLLRDVVEGRTLGDTTTLADESVVQAIRDRADSGATDEG